MQNAVQPATWQSSLPAEIVNPARQAPTSDQLVMHQPFVDSGQQQVQQHEAADDGTVGMAHIHSGIENHHVSHAIIAPAQQPGVYINGEEDYRNIEAGHSAVLAPVLKEEGSEEAEHAETTVPEDDGVHTGTKRNHTTHAGHVEPAINADSRQPVCFFPAHCKP